MLSVAAEDLVREQGPDMAALLAPHPRIQPWLRRVAQACAPHYDGAPFAVLLAVRCSQLRSTEMVEHIMRGCLRGTVPVVDKQQSARLDRRKKPSFCVAANAFPLSLPMLQRYTPCCASRGTGWWRASSSRPASCSAAGTA
jgi:hypothetical protein